IQSSGGKNRRFRFAQKPGQPAGLPKPPAAARSRAVFAWILTSASLKPSNVRDAGRYGRCRATSVPPGVTPQSPQSGAGWRSRSLCWAAAVRLRPNLCRMVSAKRGGESARRSRRFHRDRLDAPDLAGVFLNRPVAGKFSHARRVQDAPAGPALLIQVGRGGLLLRFEVGLEVGQHHVAVALVQQRIDDRPKLPRLLAREVIAGDPVENVFQRGAALVSVARPVAGAFGGAHLVGLEAEDENILGADFR